MNRQIKSIQRGLILAVLFYTVVTALAISMMNVQGSVFRSRGVPEINTDPKDESGETDLGIGRTKPAPIEGLVTGNVGMEEPIEETEIPSEPAEPQTEAATEPSEPAEEAPKYYSFITVNHDTILNMRIAPDIDSKSIDRLDPGTKGYVLEIGDEWSYVGCDGRTGYCSNEYLSLTEIQKEDIPEAYFEAAPGEKVNITED